MLRGCEGEHLAETLTHGPRSGEGDHQLLQGLPRRSGASAAVAAVGLGYRADHRHRARIGAQRSQRDSDHLYACPQVIRHNRERCTEWGDRGAGSETGSGERDGGDRVGHGPRVEGVANGSSEGDRQIRLTAVSGLAPAGGGNSVHRGLL